MFRACIEPERQTLPTRLRQNIRRYVQQTGVSPRFPAGFSRGRPNLGERQGWVKGGYPPGLPEGLKPPQRDCALRIP